jgi:hypothetical protein
MTEIQKPPPQEKNPLDRAFEKDINSIEKILAAGNKVYSVESKSEKTAQDGRELELLALCSSFQGEIESLGIKHLIVYARSGNKIVGRRGVSMRYNGSYFSASGAYIETSAELRGQGIAGVVERFHGSVMQEIASLSGKEIAEEVENANADKLEYAAARPDKYSPDEVAQLENEQKAWRKLFSRDNGYVSNTKIYQPDPVPNSLTDNKMDFKEIDVQGLKALLVH